MTSKRWNDRGERPRRRGDTKANVDVLIKEGVSGHYYVSPDTAYDRLSWPSCLYEFAPLLFKY